MAFDACNPFFSSRLPSKRAQNPPLDQISRRAALLALAGTGLGLLARSAQAGEPLAPSKPPAKDVWQRVQVALEITGELKLSPDGQKPTRAPLEVTSQQSYVERLPGPHSAYSHLAALRHYDQAKAEFQVGRSNYSTRLDDSRRLVGVEPLPDGQIVLFSPLAPFSRDELDLLEVPCNSAVLHQLLPTKSVPVGGSWQPADLIWAQLLGLETIQENQVQVKFDRWDGDSAMLVADGTLQGSVGGVATDLEVKAKLQFDRKAGRIRWIALGLTEDRAIGHAEPGFNATLRVRVSLEPVKDGGPLTDRAIANLPWESSQAGTLIVFSAHHAGLRLLLDRQWRVMTHRPENVILRLVDHGDLVAQCNLTRLPALPPGKQLSMAEFQDDIRQALGKNFQQFAEATQTAEEGQRFLRVVAVGAASDLPIQWIYQHVSDEQGRRLVAVFTVEADLVERFAEADRALVATVEFLAQEPSPAGAKPDPSKPLPEDAAPQTDSSLPTPRSVQRPASETEAGIDPSKTATKR